MPTEEDRRRLAEIVEYTRGDLVARDAAALAVPPVGGGQHVHIHHHYPPAPAPVAVDTRPDPLARAVPFMMLVVGWLVIGFVIAVVLLMLTPSIVAIMGGVAGMLMAVAICFCALAVFAVGFAAMTRSLRASRTDARLMDRRLKATRRR